MESLAELFAIEDIKRFSSVSANLNDRLHTAVWMVVHSFAVGFGATCYLTRAKPAERPLPD